MCVNGSIAETMIVKQRVKMRPDQEPRTKQKNGYQPKLGMADYICVDEEETDAVEEVNAMRNNNNNIAKRSYMVQIK